jgi:hypothetical protein
VPYDSYWMYLIAFCTWISKLLNDACVGNCPVDYISRNLFLPSVENAVHVIFFFPSKSSGTAILKKYWYKNGILRTFMGKCTSHEIFLKFCLIKIHNSRGSMSKKKVGITNQTKLSEDMEVHHVCRWKAQSLKPQW